MATLSSENLKATERYAEGWYKSYSGRSQNQDRHTLVLVPTTYPNVLRQDKSIYSRKQMLDTITKEAASFYESRGLQTLIAGPEGLGAGGTDLGALYYHLINLGRGVFNWLNSHKVAVRIAQSILPIAKRIKFRIDTDAEKRYLRSLRQTKIRFCLWLTLYIDEGHASSDLIPYTEQLFVSTQELSQRLTQVADHLQIFIECKVIDLHSDKSVSVAALDHHENKMMAKVLRLLHKADPDQETIQITI